MAGLPPAAWAVGCQAGLAGESPTEGDGEAAPQFRGAGVEQDRAGVVVAVQAQRLTEPGIISGVPVRAGHTPAMRADLDAPTRTAALKMAVFLAGQMDGAEGGRGEGGEHARVASDSFGDALAARQPGADELVGVGAVHLGARWAARSAAGLAGDRQDAAGFVDGRIAVQQFPGGAVDVIDAPAQQDGLDAPDCLRDAASGRGRTVNGGTPLVAPLRAGWTSGGRPVPGAEVSGV
jgi:hypothetical protein